jgi:hypothetical protein
VNDTIFITGRSVGKYFAEGSQAGLGRPSGKGRLEKKCGVLGREVGNVMGRGLLECTTEEGSPTCRLRFEFCYILYLDGCFITKF